MGVMQGGEGTLGQLYECPPDRGLRRRDYYQGTNFHPEKTKIILTDGIARAIFV